VLQRVRVLAQALAPRLLSRLRAVPLLDPPAELARLPRDPRTAILPVLPQPRALPPAAGSGDAFSGSSNGGVGSSKASIAVHCVAGLGRAPVLVAIALIEAGMSPHDAIQLVRSKRRGALNSKQLRFLTKIYRPRRRAYTAGCCTIM